MAIRLSGTINDYVGLSTDTKPVLDDELKTIPVGSRFFESDTGADWRFDGSAWGEVGRGIALNTLMLEKLDEILWELRTQTGHLQAGSGLEKKEALELARAR